MYMRLVQAKFKSEALPKIRQIYDEKIIPLLQKTEGCLYVSVIKSELHPDEGMSITLWKSQAHAEAYEKSGLYRKNLNEIKPHLSDASEWKIQLSKDMKLEYQPVSVEPMVKTYASLAQNDEKILPQEKIHLTNIRFVFAKVQPGKREEFRNIYSNEIIPALRSVKGCRYAYLTESTEDRNEIISVTIWDSKMDADEYEKSGLFDEFVGKLKHTFSELYQWKVAHEKETGKKTVTSEDLTVEYYSIITGKSFQ